jgi:hypothetical protein
MLPSRSMAQEAHLSVIIELRKRLITLTWSSSQERNKD